MYNTGEGSLLELVRNSGGKPLITDGAMGTYYVSLYGSTERCEFACISHPERIADIHRRYIGAGAQILRTNSFDTGAGQVGTSLDTVREICAKSYAIALEAAAGMAVVCADIGPVYPRDDSSPNEYYRAIIDTFLSAGAKVFCLETFAGTADVKFCAEYIKSRCSNAQIMASFSFTPDGYTHMGLSIESVMNDAAKISQVDIVGMNCGCGPNHMRLLLSRVHDIGKPLAFMPNAGYPSIADGKTVFSAKSEYFAQVCTSSMRQDIALIGGCCGTTPEHIAALARNVRSAAAPLSVSSPGRRTAQLAQSESPFASKMRNGQFVIAAELDPPAGGDMSKLLSAASQLARAQVDIITISDSPMARTKLDPVIAAGRVRRDCAIDVLPHICCRDRNVSALRSLLFGAHSEGIRSVLCVTGDPVAEAERGYIKPVFNLNSVRLMQTVSDMNREFFPFSPFALGGALNPAVANREAELERIKRKIEAGAQFLLTQPIYTTEHLDFIEQARALGIRVLGGIMPLVSARNAQYMSSEVPGMNIPREIVSRFTPEMSREECTAQAVNMTLELARLLRPYVDGYYFMVPFNRADIICTVLENLRSEQII